MGVRTADSAACITSLLSPHRQVDFTKHDCIRGRNSALSSQKLLTDSSWYLGSLIKGRFHHRMSPPGDISISEPTFPPEESSIKGCFQPWHIGLHVYVCFKCAQLHMCVHVCIRTCIGQFVCICVYVLDCIILPVCMRVYICLCVCVYAFAYTQIWMHSHPFLKEKEAETMPNLCACVCVRMRMLSNTDTSCNVHSMEYRTLINQWH